MCDPNIDRRHIKVVTPHYTNILATEYTDKKRNDKLY